MKWLTLQRYLLRKKSTGIRSGLYDAINVTRCMTMATNLERRIDFNDNTVSIRICHIDLIRGHCVLATASADLPVEVGSPFLNYQACLERDLSLSVFTAAVSNRRPQAFGDSCMSKIQAYEWYKEFKADREIVEDLPRSGRPSTSTTADNIDKIKTLVLENRHECSRVGSRVRHFDNGMKRIAARLVPKDMNVLQKEHRKQVALDMVSRADQWRLSPKKVKWAPCVIFKIWLTEISPTVTGADNEPNFMKRIITGDEAWVYEYDMQTSRQSSEWRYDDEPKPKKPRQSRSKVKVILTFFFIEAWYIPEFLPEGQTVNKEYYLGIWRRLRENLLRLKQRGESTPTRYQKEKKHNAAFEKNQNHILINNNNIEPQSSDEAKAKRRKRNNKVSERKET
ncbi:hypothetical protein NQ318_009873 [Aromia moschata]|uniref:Uncharacterized protein n=1 Tax=Aromia moschata TaxID=1265417 RepID=A0AAV8Y312_9CUCU|nr:hypothetical protein NQ318_009873 [Aromia moschata]